jgi:hypothetical protein
MSNFDKKVFRVFAEEKVTKVYYQDVIASSTEEVIKIIDGQKDGLAWIEDNEHPEAGAGDFKVFEEQAKPLQREELENSLKREEYDDLYEDWWDDTFRGESWQKNRDKIERSIK